MRSVINYMLTFILLIGSIASYAQQGTTITDKRGGHWIVGLDAGVAWQQSDVKTRHGGGWGFNIGKNLFYRETSPISLDLRGRYMGTWTYGLNSESTLLSSMDSSYLNAAPVFKQYDSTSYVFHNHKTEFHDLALELRLNLENLRRKTNVHLGLYAGLGLGFYNSTFEHLDLTDNPYDYESINQNQTPSKICSDIKDLWQLNRDYESAANIKEDFNVTVTPSIGLELGYWFSPGFMMGVGHRTTFTLQDDFEGVIQDNGAGINSAIHHYTNLFLTANIYGKKKRVDVDCPDINFNYPSSNNGSFTTDQQTVVVRATVKNVSRNELTFSINGNTSQNYSLGSNDFEAAVNLQAGSNIITIKGTNECGTNAQNITIVYNPQKDPEQPPVVTITNPANSPTTVNSSTIDINATIQYVSSSSDVTFTVNGQPSRNFTFSGTSFRANNVNLKIGSNVITVTGSNSVGSDSKSVIINYQKDRQPPIVDITFPSTSPYNSDASTINIVASIQHVSNANDVTFSINGQNSRSFTFNGTSFMANNVQLNKGSNVIIVTGRNTDGQDAETVIINYKEQPKPAPVVTITYPSNNPFNTNINTVNISATIQHVASSSDVTFNVNGQNNRNFSFNGTSFTANNINLNPGSNTFTITGRNTEGSDTKSTVVIYKQPEPAPVVTITNPRANPYTSQNNTVNITATILNVTGKSNVTFSVNGMNNGNFNFSGTNFNANNINLRTGSNTVTITGRNNSGQDTKSTVIIYQPAPKPGPIVTITSPIANPHNTQNSTINITATILNVTSKNDVTFTANGQNLSNFNFNGTSFSASNIRLKPGSNTFTITGRNAQGQDTKSTVVI
ncbi:MAG: hypothetical protein GY810_09230, partial [Aureispira sp.]|nr:hypothetical protein [Aureispira sp.]